MKMAERKYLMKMGVQLEFVERGKGMAGREDKRELEVLRREGRGEEEEGRKARKGCVKENGRSAEHCARRRTYA